MSRSLIIRNMKTKHKTHYDVIEYELFSNLIDKMFYLVIDGNKYPNKTGFHSGIIAIRSEHIDVVFKKLDDIYTYNRGPQKILMIYFFLLCLVLYVCKFMYFFFGVLNANFINNYILHQEHLFIYIAKNMI